MRKNKLDKLILIKFFGVVLICFGIYLLNSNEKELLHYFLITGIGFLFLRKWAVIW